ncbi:MAG: short-chain fatty acyl-CoA regulator family protein [Pseudomonadota bacterium]|nr:short-chain fatty acyl-CoA regulator family protein [Pseudomonadota bacterium]
MARKPAKDAPKIGPKIRRLRREHSLSQAALAEKLEVSASYLNLIEHNRRKLTVPLLLKLSELFEVPVDQLAEEEESRLYSDVMEALADPIFEEFDVRNTDVRDLVEVSPESARALLHVCDAYHTTLTDARSLAASAADDPDGRGSLGGLIGGIGASAQSAADVVSDMVQANSNYFGDLEDEADRVRREIGTVGGTVRSLDALSEYLHQAHEVRVNFVEPHDGGKGDLPMIRRYHPQQRLLEVSQRLTGASRSFQLAYQIALLSAGSVIDMLLMEKGLKEGQARALGRVALANYFAAALLLPYDEFLRSARESRYDIELLQHRWRAGFEQICHRLTTLNRPDNRGIPLHMLRVDLAGNISKRFTLSGLPIPRHGGACSRWNIYSAFLNPNQIQAQVSKLPDGTAYFCIARTVVKGGIGFGAQRNVLSIGLGCDVRYAREMVYADGLEIGNPDRFAEIGVACRICERMDCTQRAFPPVHLRYKIEENIRGPSPYTAPGWPHHHERPGGTR